MARAKKAETETAATQDKAPAFKYSTTELLLTRIANALERIAGSYPGTLNPPTGPIPELRDRQREEYLARQGPQPEPAKAEPAKAEPPAPEPDPVTSLLGADTPAVEEPRKATFEQARAALMAAAVDPPKGIGSDKVLAILKKELKVERLSAAPKDEVAFGRFVTALEAATGRK